MAGERMEVLSTRSKKSSWKGNRAFNDRGDSFIGPYDGPDVVIHELGHSLEYFDASIKASANRFLERRTVGETAKSLREITGYSKYELHEIAKPDAFIRPYTGKVYLDKATETISMGLQHMWNDALSFWEKDPDHFKFIWNLMHGVLE
jgi:hypothetical protein